MPVAIKKRKSLLQKQMPTIVGIAVLVIALVAGLFLFSDGTGVFSPRADSQLIPKNVRLTNVTDNSFTVSFFTDGATVSFIKYGQQPSRLNSQASDDRAQLSGTAGNYNLHHITVRGLNAGTTYYYVLGTGDSGTTFDNQGSPFQVTTAAQLNETPQSTMIYGNVYGSGGTPAEGGVVYVNLPNAGSLSALVRNTGGWGIPLAMARTEDGSNYANFETTTQLTILVQGTSLSETASYQTTVGEAQPVADINLGSGQETVVSPTNNPEPTQVVMGTSPSPTATLTPTIFPTTAVDSFDLSDDLSSSASSTTSTASAVLTLSGNDEATPSTVVNQQPIIKGQALPKVEVKFEIHSNKAIETSVYADENGEFSLDLASLGEKLEPGEHTITYTYIDAGSGEEVTRTQSFLVEDTDRQLAQATTYGSGNPYPQGGELTPTISPTITPSINLSPTASVSAEPTLDTKGGTKSAVVATSSGTFNAGTFETTLALIALGFFFITSGIWSWWLATKVEEKR